MRLYCLLLALLLLQVVSHSATSTTTKDEVPAKNAVASEKEAEEFCDSTGMTEGSEDAKSQTCNANEVVDSSSAEEEEENDDDEDDEEEEDVNEEGFWELDVWGKPQFVTSETREATMKVIEATRKYMNDVVFLRPRYSKGKYECRNREHECSLWASEGSCDEEDEEYYYSKFHEQT